MILWEMECDEGSTFFFKVQKITIIESCARHKRIASSKFMLVQCVVLFLTFCFFCIEVKITNLCYELKVNVCEIG